MTVGGSLLSQYFLTEGIRNTRAWQELDDATLKILFERFKERLDDFHNRENLD